MKPPYLLLLALTTALPGCSSRPRTSASAPVVVAAASDLQQVMPDLIIAYHRHAPSITIEPTYGASGQLAQQIKAVAPYDLYLAANEAFPRDLATENFLLPESVHPYAVGGLAIATRDDSKLEAKTLADLERPEFKRIAIANPDTAPYGAAARALLLKAGLWDAIQPRLVIAENVRQALQFVETGNAEAGLVGKAGMIAPHVKLSPVDPTLHDPIIQTLGVVARSTRKDDAAAFAKFLTSPEGQVILVSHGFRPAPRTPGPPPTAPNPP